MAVFNYDNAAGAKLLAVLEAVGSNTRPSKLAEIVRRTKLPRATVFRLLAFLTHHGYLYKGESDDTYLIGYKLFILGHLNRLHENVRLQSRPFLLRLTHDHALCAQIAYLEFPSIVILDKFQTQDSPAIPTTRGQRVSAASTALGRALLAYHDPTSVPEPVSGLKRGRRQAQHNVLIPESLGDSLQAVRSKGYVVVHGQFAPKISCVAVPVLDFVEHAFFAISLSGPTDLIKRDEDALIKSVGVAAAELRRCVLWRDINDEWLDPRW